MSEEQTPSDYSSADNKGESSSSSSSEEEDI